MELKLILNILLVLVCIYIVPLIVYGLFSKFSKVKLPEGASPTRFLVSILISKIGTAITFVLIFYFAQGAFINSWQLYVLLWWIMFVIGEIGQMIGPNYSLSEAIAGIISETIYLPAAGYITYLLLS